MFKILVTDDDYEDRELLKLEIKKALGDQESDLRFVEASSVKDAKKHLNSQFFDLMTLDIQMDRMNEGIEALPDLFETYPTLNIIVVSGRLDKVEVTQQLFKFTKDNVLKSKRWARHFDVIDKKDDKTDAINHAYSVALKRPELAGELKELFLLAESYMEKGMVEKCLDVYAKIKNLVPGDCEIESGNISIFRNNVPVTKAFRQIKSGDRIVGALLMGHYLEKQLKSFTREKLGRSFARLYDCANELLSVGQLNKESHESFMDLIKLRNKGVHSPSSASRRDFDQAEKKLKSIVEV